MIEWKETLRSLSGVNFQGNSSEETANSKAFGFRGTKTFLTATNTALLTYVLSHTKHNKNLSSLIMTGHGSWHEACHLAGPEQVLISPSPSLVH